MLNQTNQYAMILERYINRERGDRQTDEQIIVVEYVLRMNISSKTMCLVRVRLKMSCVSISTQLDINYKTIVI